MYYHNFLYLISILKFMNTIVAQNQNGITFNGLNGFDVLAKLLNSDSHTISNKYSSGKDGKGNFKIFYETRCPSCEIEYKYKFAPMVEELSQSFNITTIPYGFAETIVDKGRITFKCQHGPEECYGNMLHACAVDYLQNITKAVTFNACMIDAVHGGSDDAAADMCGKQLNVDSKPIKKCAKGTRGIELHKYYGEKTKEANVKFLPYFVIDNRSEASVDLMETVCQAFSVPPPECAEFY